MHRACKTCGSIGRGDLPCHNPIGLTVAELTVIAARVLNPRINRQRSAGLATLAITAAALREGPPSSHSAQNRVDHAVSTRINTFLHMEGDGFSSTSRPIMSIRPGPAQNRKRVCAKCPQGRCA